MRRLVALLLLAAFASPQDAPEKRPPDLHKIYVPYKKLDEVLGTDKERVMVPYKEFLELWKLKYGPKARPDQPPVPFTVESASYTGRVASGLATFGASIEIEVFSDAWQRIPLSFSRVAFEEVTVDGAPGVIAPTKKGYELILRGKGRHKVAARFVAGIEKGKEFATCSFGLPSVPLHKMEFRVPGKGTEIRIEPARAHTVTNEKDETLLLAFLGPQNSVKLTWRYQPEEKEQEPPLLFSTDTVDLSVEERVVRGSVRFDLQVLRTPAAEFRVRIPEKAQVLEVSGARIKTWTFEDQQRRVLKVTLHQPALGAYPLTVAFERPIKVPGLFDLPVFKIEGATRERGFVRVASAEGVGVRPTSLENVFQADLDSLPKAIRGGARALGFRFPALPYALGLSTERIKPFVSLLSRMRLSVERRTYSLDAELRFTVERAGLFSLRLEVPEKITLTEIGGTKLVDSYRESRENGKRIYTLELRGRKIGSFVCPIRAEAPLDLAQGALAAPLIKVLGVDREEGTLGVYMDPGIKASATTEGVIPMEPAKLAREDRFRSSLPLAFAWRWRGPGAKVDFAVEPRKPKVTCDVRYNLQAEEARVRVKADLVYTVKYTGVETFRFRVPKRIADKLKVDGRNIREKPHTDDEIEKGKEPTVTYKVSLQGPALGPVVLSVEYDENFPEPLQVNESRPVAIPAIVPLDVDRANTFAAIRKSPAIKVGSSGEGYEQIDPAELPSPLRAGDVILALRRFDAPEPFPLELTKHQYQPVADLVVRHTHLETVLSGEGKAMTTAYFEILNNDRQFLAVKLQEGSDVRDVRSGGKPEKPRIGVGGVLLIPLLTGLRKDATFVVAVAYAHKIDESGHLWKTTHITGPVLPAFEDLPAPAQLLLTWNVHYPQSWNVTSFGGNVEPAGKDADHGSWLRRSIDLVGRMVRPGEASAKLPEGRSLRPAEFADIVPMFKERESVSSLFTNGVGDGVLEIRHSSMPVQVGVILLAILAGIGATFFCARALTPSWSGALPGILALLLLAFAGRAFIPVWNGVLAGAILATVLGIVRAMRGRRA